MLRGARWGGGISHPSCCVRSFILEWKQCLMLSDKSLLSRMPPCLEFNTESQISLSCFAQLRTLLEAFSVHLRLPSVFFNFRLLTEQLIKIEQINPLLSMRIAWGPWDHTEWHIGMSRFASVKGISCVCSLHRLAVLFFCCSYDLLSLTPLRA